jgi:voltage-gated potassium channel
MELLQIKRENMDGLVAEFPQVKTVMEQFFRDRMLQTVMAVSPLLSRLNPAEQTAISQRMRLVEVAENKKVIRENDEGKGFFVVAYGEVSVTMHNEFGGEDELATLGMGEFFGEMALLGNRRTSANVSTTQKSAFLVLSKEDFNTLVTKSPAVAAVLKQFAEERAQKNAEIHDSLTLLGEQGLV